MYVRTYVRKSVKRAYVRLNVKDKMSLCTHGKLTHVTRAWVSRGGRTRQTLFISWGRVWKLSASRFIPPSTSLGVASAEEQHFAEGSEPEPCIIGKLSHSRLLRRVRVGEGGAACDGSHGDEQCTERRMCQGMRWPRVRCSALRCIPTCT